VRARAIANAIAIAIAIAITRGGKIARLLAHGDGGVACGRSRRHVSTAAPVDEPYITNPLSKPRQKAIWSEFEQKFGEAVIAKEVPETAANKGKVLRWLRDMRRYLA